jgi:apolipoprotein N-acyltransferase
MSWVITLLAAALNVAAWIIPGSLECAILGWSSALLFAGALAIPTSRIKRLFAAGCLTYLGGFYWLYWTIQDFGGFPFFAAAPIFLLFVAGSAIQFLIWGFVWRYLPPLVTRLGLTTAVSWLIAHHFWIKIFPWDFGHTQLAFTAFSQIADIAGVTGITFIMFWVAESIVARKRVSVAARIIALASLIGSLSYGVGAPEKVAALQGTPLKTYLVQGNISLHHKHNVQYFTVNREQYVKISSMVAEKDSLVVWPESTITEFIPATTHDAKSSTILPFLNNGSAFLVGGLTFESRAKYFNSSLLIRPDGSVAEPYHKMILMPFGEYTPLASWIPFLRDINATAGQFTAGDAPKVLTFQLSSGAEVRVAPLICYEDIIPSLAQEAVRKGAEVLINQTNDAWFGDTVAPYQHHLIASFRAIENRRYLLRSTNTGLTAVVDPVGRTLASLAPYSEGVLPMDITLSSYRSFFSRYPVDLMWLLIAAAGVLIVVKRALSRT